MIYYNMEEFKEEYDKLVDEIKPKRIGLYAWHAKWHSGHQKCADMTNEKCDLVVGAHYQNFGREQLRILDVCYDKDKPWTEEDLKPFNYCDIGYCQKNDYSPALDQHYDFVHKEFSRLYSNDYLIKEGIIGDGNHNLYASLRLATYWKCMFHEVYGIHADYCVNSGRDPWRFVGYIDWLWYKYGCRIDDIDPVRDELGNVISGMKEKLPQELKDRIKKTLVLPTFKSKEDVEEHIKDIEGLHVGYFFRRENWIQLKFYFEPHQWWADGLKLEKDEK